jgi:hypothetical protein
VCALVLSSCGSDVGSVVADAPTLNEPTQTPTPAPPSASKPASHPRAIIFVYMGESLLDGSPEGEQQGTPTIPLATADSDAVMMLNGGVRLDRPDGPGSLVMDSQVVGLVPLLEAGKQTPAAALGRRLASSYGIASVHINVAVSGARYSSIRPGTIPYSNGIKALRAAVALLKAKGFAPEVELIVEEAVNDSGSGSDHTWVWSNLRELQTTFAIDARAALEDGTASVQMFTYTPISVGGGANRDWVAGGVATYQAENSHYCGSLTGIEYFDTHHQTGLGEARVGDVLLWPAIESVVAKGQAWTPFRPVAQSATHSGASISFLLEGFIGKPVYLADSWAPALSDWGLNVTTRSGSIVAVTAVSFDALNPAKVNLTLAADPGPNAIITGALHESGYTAAATDKAHTNIADQSPLTSLLDGRPFPRRLGQFLIVAK